MVLLFFFYFVDLAIFYQGLQATCANGLFDHLAIFHDGGFLKIWFEFSVCSVHGKAATSSKGGRFSTNFTFSHFQSLSKISKTNQNKVK